MTTQLSPAELRRQRKERKAKEAAEAAEAAGATGEGSGESGDGKPPVVAQGRAQPMLTLSELPRPVDAPDAEGPLSEDEAERWELCQRSFQQYRSAWWVAARGLDVSLRGRLWRVDYESAAAFIEDVAGMSTSNAYRQIAGAEIAAVLAGQPVIELESNEQSRMRDSAANGSTISQRAAESLRTIREDYGAETAAEAFKAVASATGERPSEKLLTGIVQQLPRRQVQPLEGTVLLARVRDLATASSSRREGEGDDQPSAPVDPVKAFKGYVGAVRKFSRDTKGMAAAYEAAASVNQEEADKLAKRMAGYMRSAARNFPDV